MNEQKLTAALDKALSRITDETGLVGGVVNVVKGGKTVYLADKDLLQKIKAYVVGAAALSKP